MTKLPTISDVSRFREFLRQRGHTEAAERPHSELRSALKLAQHSEKPRGNTADVSRFREFLHQRGQSGYADDELRAALQSAPPARTATATPQKPADNRPPAEEFAGFRSKPGFSLASGRNGR
jgi:hypothetical protein